MALGRKAKKRIIQSYVNQSCQQDFYNTSESNHVKQISQNTNKKLYFLVISEIELDEKKN